MRLVHELLLGAALLPIALAQPAKGDAVPFDEWLKGGHDAHIDWSLRTSHAVLSENQRLAISISVELKVDEVRKRPAPGQMVFILQVRDATGHTYRSPATPIYVTGHTAPGSIADWNERLFVVPGDYDLAAAIYDTVTKEHSLKRSKLHIAGIARDPLPDSWRDTRSLGFIAEGEPSRKLWLPVETARPVRVEIIATQPVMGAQARNLMARLGVLSQMTIRTGSMGIRVLDLGHQKVVYSQEGGAPLDMQQVGAALGNRDPRIVHADVLSKYQEGAQFLVEQVRSALESKGSSDVLNDVSHVVIVLSAPWDFPKDGVVPVAQAELPPQSRVFYVRCDAAGYMRYIPPPSGTLSTRTSRPGPPLSEPDMSPNLVRIGPDNSDSLAATLKLLPARIIDVATPTDFRHALADIIREMEQLN